MLPYQNFSYGQQPIWNEDWMKKMAMEDGGSISMTQKQKSEAAAQKHAKAEQLRRKRINTHIQTLKKLLLPNITSKKVKASVLTETIRQVKESRKRAADVALQQHGQGWFGSGVLETFTYPDESDDTTVTYCEGGGEGKTVKVMVCCEDRPGLNRDLTEAIRSAGGKPVRAEMATFGGRTKAEVVVRWVDGSGGEEEVGLLTRALKALVDSGASGFSSLGQIMGVNGPAGLSSEVSSNKRAEMYNSSFDSDWESLFLSTF
ncbi:hypothetical protein Vadar_001990 [Vaccinium darrowii]|uniref:Uncharacterized protein n=1 Tax=Vaccinium darrowii TaxID=229202 RepID=A0ACB7Y4X1_9ERIC|nr:hypothetical protein Vadar_001990 [Vaccinium darrowii]